MDFDTITYTAAIATASDVVTGDFCDVCVIENEIDGWREDEYSNDVKPVYGMTSRTPMEPVETNIRVDDEDKLSKAADAADEILRANGWNRTDDWSFGDNAMYATVERD